MLRRPLHLLLVVLVIGGSFVCIAALRADDEVEVKAAFTALQTALKAGDHEKLWSLVDSTSQAEADKYAKMVQASYAKSGDDEKAKLEKAFGLSADEMSKITGKLYLKSKPFLAKHREVPGSKIDKVVIAGDKATLHYIEEDNDKVKLDLVRRDGKWTLSIAVK